MSAHTPGPWWRHVDSTGRWSVKTYRDSEESDPRANYGCEYGASICGGIGDHTESRTSGNEEANAHLIAAAPELLDALELILSAEDRGFGMDYVKGCARAVIAKAKGETQ